MVLIDYSHPINRGLKNYWTFNEGAGIGAYDSGPVGAHGTLTNFAGSPTSGWKGGITGSAPIFDGSNDYVALDTTKMSWINSGSISFSFWIKSTNAHATYMCIFARGLVQTAATYGISIELSTALVLAFFRNDATTGASHQYSTSTIPSAADKFVHCVLVFDRDRLVHRHFINGVENTVAYPQSTPRAGDIVYNGTYDNGYAIGAMRRNVSDFYTLGIIDNFRIYNRALTLEEAKLLYNYPDIGILINRSLAHYSPHGAGYSSFTGVSTTTGISSITF